MIAQHFLIATTMLVVGLFAVLSWDATFPDRRDVLVLAPLPVRARTMFLAKVAAVATALGLTIVLLHSALGLISPLVFAAYALTGHAPGVDARCDPGSGGGARLASRDGPRLEAAVDHRGTGAGHERGDWQSESGSTASGESLHMEPRSRTRLFEIGSISKTFTGLMLARMVAEGKVRLDEPVRRVVAGRDGEETHRRGDYAARPGDASFGIAADARQLPPGRPMPTLSPITDQNSSMPT